MILKNILLQPNWVLETNAVARIWSQISWQLCNFINWLYRYQKLLTAFIIKMAPAVASWYLMAKQSAQAVISLHFSLNRDGIPTKHQILGLMIFRQTGRQIKPM